jgi:probable HAF family extracellular repeat protein
VTGYAGTASGDSQAFVYDGAALKALGTLGGKRSEASAINASATTAASEQRAILWTEAEGLIDLNTRIPRAPAGAMLHAAFAVSDNGSIVAGANTGLVLLKVHAP